MSELTSQEAYELLQNKGIVFSGYLEFGFPSYPYIVTWIDSLSIVYGIFNNSITISQIPQKDYFMGLGNIYYVNNDEKLAEYLNDLILYLNKSENKILFTSDQIDITYLTQQLYARLDLIIR